MGRKLGLSVRERLADRIHTLNRALRWRHVDGAGAWLSVVSADCAIGFCNTNPDGLGGPYGWPAPGLDDTRLS